MKPVNYPNNGNGLMVQYHIMREGPNYFMISYKNSSVLRQDPKETWRVLGPAKFTAGAQELKQWCLDIHDQYANNEKKGRKDTSFGNEGQQELETESNPSSNTDDIQAEPNDNTKMIV